MDNVVATIAPSFFILAGNKVNFKSLDVFEILPEQTLDCGVSCLCASWKISIDL